MSIVSIMIGMKLFHNKYAHYGVGVVLEKKTNPQMISIKWSNGEVSWHTPRELRRHPIGTKNSTNTQIWKRKSKYEN